MAARKKTKKRKGSKGSQVVGGKGRSFKVVGPGRGKRAGFSQKRLEEARKRDAKEDRSGMFVLAQPGVSKARRQSLFDLQQAMKKRRGR